ncbi:amino acid adenylation domain-containing protein [Streptomyces sp. NPDC087844]|uniref:amino acid adenylation domain-containing protein n=1 Tax=Streptomyces sp. NPDC087844 TaxID=3365805 RepID=UPI0037F29C48
MRAHTAPQRLPLSAGQREIWLSQQLDPAGPAFRIAEYLLIRGPIDPTAFEAALRQAIAEAEPYHARYGEEDGVPWQVIELVDDWEFPIVDVSAETDPLAAAEKRMREIVAQPIGLDRPPLFIHVLFRLGPECFAWLQCLHHIVADAAGGALVARRVAELYTVSMEAQLRSGGQPCSSQTAARTPASDDETPRTRPLGPLSALLNSDAAYRSSDAFVSDKAYWMEHLADWPTPARLQGSPTGLPTSVIRRTVVLSEGEAAGLRAAARAAGTHWSALIVAATAAYLHRMTGRDDIMLTLPVSARTDVAQRTVPGMFANVVPLRLRVTADTPMRQLIRHASREMRQALRHQRFRRADLAHALRLPQGGQHHLGPHVNIMALDYDVTFHGHPATAHNVSNGLVDDVAIMVYDRSDGQGLRVDLNANSDLYSPDALGNHADRFLRLLKDFAHQSDPERTVSAAELLTADEEIRVRRQSTGALRTTPESTLVGMLAAQALRTPHRTALIDGASSHTYRELHEAANRLAHLLAERGARPGRTVAVALPRSADLVIALTAVLATGAAYLPLDPEYPADRLAYLLDDVEPALVVTRTDTAPVLPGDRTSHLLLDTAETQGLLDAQPATAPTADGLRPQDPAYLIHTSGSTGAPKGVVVPHRAVTNMLRWMQHTYRIDGSDRLLQKTPTAFDASVPELFWPLTSGATLVLAAPGSHRDPHTLARLICREAISVVQFVPTVLDAFLDVLAADADTAKQCERTLRMVFSGGEVLTRTTVDRFHSLLPGVPLHNVYGPTETAVDVAHHTPRPGERGPVPLGTSVWNTRLYVMDERLRLCPPGAPGELYIAGKQLADGYHRRAELTTERFLTDPYGPPGDRMYRTGDLARRDDDGALHFLGRADDQVKLNGFRIELGEVDTALRALPGVRQAASTLRTTASGDRQLVAHLAGDCGMPQDAEEIRGLLARTLPAHLVPATVMVLTELPLTPSGKLDRANLPEPATPRVAAGGRPPRTPLERQLCTLFGQILNVDDVSVDHDFFDLGGTSLAASRLASHVRTDLGMPLSLHDLFSAPTVARLAVHLDDETTTVASRAEADLAPLLVLRELDAASGAAPLFCLHPGGGIGWIYGALLRHLGVDQPVYALQARALTPPHPLPSSVKEMADDYVELIRTVQPTGPYHLLGWSFGGLLAHAVATRLQGAGGQVATLTVLDGYPAESDSLPDLPELDRSEWLGLLREALPSHAAPDANTQHEKADPGDADGMLAEAVQALGLPAVLLEGDDTFPLQDIMRNDLRLQNEYTPDIYDGDMLLLTADLPTAGGLFEQPSPDAWGPYVNGTLTIQGVQARHHHMLRAESLDLIGSLLAGALSGERSFPRAVEGSRPHPYAGGR